MDFYQKDFGCGIVVTKEPNRPAVLTLPDYKMSMFTINALEFKARFELAIIEMQRLDNQ